MSSKDVSGSAMMRPTKPSNDPHTDSDSSMIAGLSPVASPMIRGVRNASCMTCAMRKTAIVSDPSNQKLVPPSAAPMMQRNSAGM